MDAGINLAGEYTCRETESRFRLGQERQEVRQMRSIWGLATLCFGLYAPIDLVGAPFAGDGLLALRATIVLIGLGVVLALGHSRGRRHRDLIACLALLAVLCCYGAIIGLRPWGGGGALLLLLVGNYLFSPCRYALHLTTGLLGSACAVFAAACAGSIQTIPWGEFSYLVPANLLAAIALSQANRARRLLFSQRLALDAEVRRRRSAQARLARLHRRSTRLLYNTLPPQVARQMRSNPRCRPARELACVTVSFADIAGFSGLATRLPAASLVRLLNDIFTGFDAVSRELGVEKIKTIGDAYMAVAGLDSAPDAAERAVRLALAQHRVAERVSGQWRLPLKIRVGLHSGAAVSGVLGTRRYAFDLWGDSVNVASRLQAVAPIGETLVSASARRLCPDWIRFGPEREWELRGCGSVWASLLRRVSAVVV